MGLFDRFKKKPEVPPDFSGVDSREKAEELARKGVLCPLYLMPLRFGGSESLLENTVLATPAAVALKDRFDDRVEKLLEEGRVNGYTCEPQYRGTSFIPCAVKVTARKDGADVLTETIHIW